MIRVVIDTNVLVSAMLSPAGNEALLLMAINQELVTPYFSVEILAEYSDVLIRPRFAFPADEVAALLGLLRRVGHLLKPAPIERVSPDPDDDKFIACALQGRVEFLVTGNKRHFPPSPFEDLRVVNATELLDLITGNYEERTTSDSPTERNFRPGIAYPLLEAEPCIATTAENSFRTMLPSVPTAASESGIPWPARSWCVPGLDAKSPGCAWGSLSTSTST